MQDMLMTRLPTWTGEVDYSKERALKAFSAALSGPRASSRG